MHISWLSWSPDGLKLAYGWQRVRTCLDAANRGAPGSSSQELVPSWRTGCLGVATILGGHRTATVLVETYSLRWPAQRSLIDETARGPWNPEAVLGWVEGW